MRYVYLVRAGRKEYKVGIAQNINKRIKGLQTSNANKIELITAKQTPDYRQVESSIHKLLAKHKKDGGREWFALSAPQVINICILINQSPGITISEVETLELLIGEQKEIMRQHETKQQQILSKAESILEQAKAQLQPKIVIQKVEEKQTKQRPEKVDEGAQEKIIQDAIEVIQLAGKASTSLLQRHMRIGYGRASRIIDELERRRIISPPDGSHPRDIYLEQIGLKEDALVAAVDKVLELAPNAETYTP